MILIISCYFLLLLGAHLYLLDNRAKSQTLSFETGQLHCVPLARPNASADAWRFISFKVALDPFASQPFLKSLNIGRQGPRLAWFGTKVDQNHPRPLAALAPKNSKILAQWTWHGHSLTPGDFIVAFKRLSSTALRTMASQSPRRLTTGPTTSGGEKVIHQSWGHRALNEVNEDQIHENPGAIVFIRAAGYGCSSP